MPQQLEYEDDGSEWDKDFASRRHRLPSVPMTLGFFLGGEKGAVTSQGHGS